METFLDSLMEFEELSKKLKHDKKNWKVTNGLKDYFISEKTNDIIMFSDLNWVEHLYGYKENFAADDISGRTCNKS